MFRRILIANRGEIACRVARTCRRLGVESVAVHSRADAGALHVRAADRATALDGAGPADGYLDAAGIVDAARRCGADAVHPGYGFLSENAEFAEACAAAGIRFIGPAADSIRRMGDKARARAIAREAGVAVVPGVEEPPGAAGDRDRALCVAAASLQYPLMVKACAGGGGRGMRRVDAGGDLPAAIALARREAMAGFGDDRLIVERYVARPRHVEVQVLGDAHGTLLHLHERDCSIQRRHQKLIEEAPAPGLAQDTRAALHAAALTLARAIGYHNAGTVEFILDARDQSFFFLEMNTRLQVEHPVTEAILGLDLVEWQIRVAAGERLPFAQEDLRPRGWAIEARLNAEDPAHDFRPATGTLAAWRPASGPGIRVDSGVGEGTRVEPFYDSLLAKLVVRGRDRAEACAGLARALADTVVAGVRSNVAFLAALVREPAFGDGDVSTHFIVDHFPGGWQPALERTDLAMAAAIRLASLEPPAAGPWRALGGFRLLAPAGHPGRWRTLLDGDDGGPLAVWMQAAGERWRVAVTEAGAPPPDLDRAALVSVRVEGEALDLVVDRRRMEGETLDRVVDRRLGEGEALDLVVGRRGGEGEALDRVVGRRGGEGEALDRVVDRRLVEAAALDGVVDGRRGEGEELQRASDVRCARLQAIERDGVLHLHGAAGWHAFRVLDAAEALHAAGEVGMALDGPLTAPVPGVVAAVEVAAGEEVAAGAPLVVLESMKMFQTLSAPAPGRVSAVHCAAGDAVTVGQALVTLEARVGEPAADAAQ